MNDPENLVKSNVTPEWLPCETGKHQDHVIAHVMGATALGYFEFDQVAHILLDIGFIWTIFADGEMGLVPQSLAISELEIEADAKAALTRDIQRAHDGQTPTEGSLLIAAPDGCLIEQVRFYSASDRRRISVSGEDSALEVDSSIETGMITIRPVPKVDYVSR
ncbi:MAG: hypothetical protein QOJ64_4193 [Acidobacteriota bacterium]|jgi:hypothetical protein|nr:hypothetical protein [Acidobacteriota bacterium]